MNDNTPKQLKFDKEARESLKAGIDKLAKAVVTTMGPRGRNVALDNHWGEPDVIHDGVSVAEKIYLTDKFENIGAQLVKQAAKKTNDQAGDGTTTATLLAQQIFDRGFKATTEENVNPMFMKRGIDKAVKVAIKELKKITKPVKKSDWEKVASISAQNSDIGKKISEALGIVGQDGLVTVDENTVPGIELEHTEGMEMDEGYITPYFSTRTDTMEAEMEEPFLLITDMSISTPEPLIPILKKSRDAGKPLVIIANKLDGEALQTLVINKLKHGMKVCAIKAPSFAEQRLSMLEDVAILTGGTVVSGDTGIRLEEVELEHCGIARKVVVGKNFTRIIGGDGTEEAVKDRIKHLKAQEKKEENEFQKTKLNERIAKLSKGAVMVKVGAATEVEYKELKERVKDAIGATKAAIEEGIIPGGGVALLNIAPKLLEIETNSSDEKKGVEIVAEAICEPIKWLAKNSGEDPANVIEELQGKEPAYGFNAEDLTYGDMLKLGVIDPVKVTRLALENGASVASMALTTECLITEDVRQEKVSDNE